MQTYDLGEGNVIDAEELNLGSLEDLEAMQDHAPQMVTVPFAEYQGQQNQIHDLQLNVETHHHALMELYGFSQNMHTVTHGLETRVAQLEQEVSYYRALSVPSASIEVQPTPHEDGDVTPEAGYQIAPAQNTTRSIPKASTKRPATGLIKTERVSKLRRNKDRKKLELKIPGKGSEDGPGLLTPMPSALQASSSFSFAPSIPTTPHTPYTPGRIGPPDSYKKTTTSINKRDIHDLNKCMPPSNVQLPMVPLTDTEVIVYFFNSLCKPAVSLRLYARGWGPASIVQALNDHRVVNPPYLRNTCSVKCTTAIKNGRKIYGADWETEYRAIFAEAMDDRATDLIRADESLTVDYYVRALGANLKQHPADENAGIFTECVKYCIEQHAPYTMSNVYQLAVALQDHVVPQHPASPAISDVVTPPKVESRVEDGEEVGGSYSEDDFTGMSSPLAERNSFLRDLGGSTGFLAINALREEEGEAEE